MSEEIEVLKIVTLRLNEQEIPYMISGAIRLLLETVNLFFRDH